MGFDTLSTPVYVGTDVHSGVSSSVPPVLPRSRRGADRGLGVTSHSVGQTVCLRDLTRDTRPSSLGLGRGVRRILGPGADAERVGFRVPGWTGSESDFGSRGGRGACRISGPGGGRGASRAETRSPRGNTTPVPPLSTPYPSQVISPSGVTSLRSFGPTFGTEWCRVVSLGTCSVPWWVWSPKEGHCDMWGVPLPNTPYCTTEESCPGPGVVRVLCPVDDNDRRKRLQIRNLGLKDLRGVVFLLVPVLTYSLWSTAPDRTPPVTCPRRRPGRFRTSLSPVDDKLGPRGFV